MCLVPSIIFSFLNFTGEAQCVAPVFPAPASIVASVPEAANYNLVYKLPIPSANQAWATQADVPYAINNSVALAGNAFSRVAYYMKLESAFTGVQWVWVSMDAFTDDVTRVGIPVGDIVYQQQVTNMNVVNNAGTNRTGVMGNLEFWSDAYEPANTAGVPNASNSLYDFGDERTVGVEKFGSFQVHDFNQSQTLFAYNSWATAGFTQDDLGIGNCGFCNHPDYTAIANASFYDVKELYVFVSPPPYQPTCNSATINLDASGNATLTVADVTTQAIGVCGVQSIDLSKTNFTCANLGSNTVTVLYNVDGIAVNCQATVTVKDLIAPALQVSGTTLALGCDPGAAAIEAALGSATATDNCANPTLEVTTSAVIVSGNNREQTRSWQAKDASNNITTESRTVKWTVNCNVVVPHIYPSDVSCKEFNLGAAPLLNVCYSYDKRKVKKVSPKNFYYYATVTAPSNLGWFNILTIDIVQTKTCANFNLYEIQGNQVRAYDENCRQIANGFEVANGQGRVIIIGATPGKEYTIWANYETKSLEGSSFSGNTAPVCSNSFVAKMSAGLFGQSTTVPNSQGSILAKPDCYDKSNGKNDFAGANMDAADDLADLSTDKLVAVASPNPSSGQFSINIQSGKNTAVTVRVLDVMGRPVYTSNWVNANSVLRLGENWKAGIYFVEIQQGEERKMMRLIKQ